MTTQVPETSRPAAITPALTGGDRRALRVLIYLTAIAVGFVVVWFLAQLVSIFSEKGAVLVGAAMRAGA